MITRSVTVAAISEIADVAYGTKFKNIIEAVVNLAGDYLEINSVISDTKSSYGAWLSAKGGEVLLRMTHSSAGNISAMPYRANKTTNFGLNSTLSYYCNSVETITLHESSAKDLAIITIASTRQPSASLNIIFRKVTNIYDGSSIVGLYIIASTSGSGMNFNSYVLYVDSSSYSSTTTLNSNVLLDQYVYTSAPSDKAVVNPVTLHHSSEHIYEAPASVGAICRIMLGSVSQTSPVMAQVTVGGKQFTSLGNGYFYRET